MAINESPVNSPVVLLAVYNATGNFVAPAGKSKVYVTAIGGQGGTGGGGSDRYSFNRKSGPGGDRRVHGGWVNVVPGTTYAVTIGAGGIGGAVGGRYSTGGTGATGGTTNFSSANVLSAPGSAGGSGPTGPGGNNDGTKGATSSVGTFATSVGPLTPWASVQAIVNTTNTNVIESSGTGTVISRYATGTVGSAGQVYIYG